MAIAPSNAHVYSLLDGLRRLEYNFYEILLAKEKKLPNGLRTANKIKSIVYSNYLSSCHSIQDLTASFCRDNSLSKHYEFIKKIVEEDELLKYVRESRNAQDHSIDQAATSPIIGFQLPYPGSIAPRAVVRGAFRLGPVKTNRKTVILDIPKTHLGKQICHVTPELVAHLSFDWWSIVVQEILQGTCRVPIPEPVSPTNIT